MARFKDFRIHQDVYDLVGRLPVEVRQCLLTAFHKIEDGKANLLPDAILRHLHATQYCDYTILLSLTGSGDIAVVVDLVAERNHMSRILDE
jgi:hypothetical protein